MKSRGLKDSGATCNNNSYVSIILHRHGAGLFEEAEMLGIILTLVAVFFVICIAFYYSDSARGSKSDLLSYLHSSQNTRKKNRGTSI